MEETKEDIQKAMSSLHVETKTHLVDQSMNLWEEVRTASQHPSRRSYHSAVMWNEKMVICGGQDLREGPQAGIWSIEIGQFDQGDWQELGVPDFGPLCRHSAVIKDDNMYLFGGSNGSEEFNRTLVVNLNTLSLRTILPDNNNIPPPLDSHTSNLYEDGTAAWIVVYGGFSIGERSSKVYTLNLATEKWKLAQTSKGPEARSNHSSVIYKDHLYIFGGTNEEGEKLADLWKLDLRTYHWEEIHSRGDVPSGRSGHSSSVYRDLMIVFGGMKDITKETNDMYSYDFNNNTWALFQFEHQVKDPVSNEQLEEFKKTRASPTKGISPTVKSPLLKKNTLDNLSPSKKSNEGSSPENNFVPKKRKTLYDGPASPVVGRIRAHPPHPRDGHSAVISNNIMIVFGGDRHQMPFNDTYVYFLVEETIKTPLRIN
jgi:Galactose oxidase, central domain/Kelch motif